MSLLVWSSIQTTKTFFISAIKLLHFLIICVFTGVELLISFRAFFCIHSSYVWWGLSFSLSQLWYAFFTKLIISSFDLKWGIYDALSLEHWEAIVRLIGWFQYYCTQGEGERWGNSWLIEQSEHIQHLCYISYSSYISYIYISYVYHIWAVCGSKTIVRIINDQRSP